MAVDWIKMRIDLQTHPKVVRILSATKSDKFRVIGGLHAVWSVFDAHSLDGVLHGYTLETMDHIIGWDGFSKAVADVDWLKEDGTQALVMPEFVEHNGQSAKRRAEDQKRKRNARKTPETVPRNSGQTSDKKRTREEKRREEYITDTNVSASDVNLDDQRPFSNKKYNYSKTEFELATQMTIPVRTRFPKQEIDLEAWADCVRKLLRIDKCDLVELQCLWAWVCDHQRGSFSWADNCRTPMKLRQKKDGLTYFEIIKTQMARESSAGGNHETRERHRKESLAERTARQTDEALAAIRSRSNGDSALGANDGFVREQVGKSNRPDEDRGRPKQGQIHEGVSIVVSENAHTN